MAKGYLSNRQKNLKLGIPSYTESNTVLEVTGNVGIGTANATSNLHVVGNGLFTGIVTASSFSGSASVSQLNVTGFSTFANNIQLNAALLLPQNPNGVGYGTTTASPLYALRQTMGDNDGWLIYGESPSGTNTGSLVLEVNDDIDVNEKIILRNRRNYAGAVIGVTTFLELTNLGNVMQSVPLLIGTATSTGTTSQPLQVTGGAYFAGVGVATGSIGVGITNPQGAIDIRTSPQWSSFNYGANLVIGGSRNNAIGILDSTNSNPWAVVNSGGNLLFAQMPALGNTTSGASEAARITTNRNLLIGSITETGTASQRLQVTGGAYVSTALGIGRTNPGSFALDSNGVARIGPAAGGKLTVGTGMAAGEFGIQILPYSDRTELQAEQQGTSYRPLVLQPFGSSVGIATTNPQYKTHIFGSGDILAIESTSASDRSTLKIVTNGSDWEVGARGSAASPANSFYIYDNAANQYRQVIDSSGNILVGGTVTSTGTTSQPLQVTGGAYVSGSVGVGTTNPQYKLHVIGSFAATTKSFVIDHPTKPDKKLRYASLEGPENGVYVRGRTQSSAIELPDYWTGLVNEESITVNLTPIGRKAPLHSVVDIIDNTVVIESANEVIDCFYTVYAERKDVEKLEVEI